MPDTDDAQIPEGYFTQAQLDEAIRAAKQAARGEERDKLYPQQTKRDEQLKAMETELAELRKAETARQKAAEKAAADAERAKQKAAEAEMSAKDLVEQRNREWQEKLDAQRAEQEARLAAIAEQQQVQQAMWEKEREMTQLAIYARDAVAAASDDIAPELVDLIGGNTREEIDASIEDMKARTQRILQGMQQAGIQQRAAMPGTAPASGATGLTPGLDGGATTQLTAEDIKGMDMETFRKLRQQHGIGSRNGAGIFG